MARATFESPVKYLQGKICKSDSTVFRVLYGQSFLSRQRRYAASVSASQKAAKAKFVAVMATVESALANAAQRLAYETAFKNQTKYKTLRGYVFSQLYSAHT